MARERRVTHRLASARLGDLTYRSNAIGANEQIRICTRAVLKVEADLAAGELLGRDETLP